MELTAAKQQHFDKYLKINEAAEFLGVSSGTLRNWDKSGKLKSLRHPINGYRIYRHQDLEALLHMESLYPQEDAIEWSEIGESEHFVQFYEDHAVLGSSVSAFIAASLRKGKGGIVVATEAHREDIKNKLEAQGVDVSSAIGNGQLVFLDAAETLASFMVDGLPSRKLFQQTVGAVVAQIAGKYTHLHAFGEMVALLWESGNREAAIILEEFWNELGKTYAFALFCAYPFKAFADNSQSQSFADICGCHSRLIPTEHYTELSTKADRLSAVALLEQKAAMLEAEIAHRKEVEKSFLKREQELKDFFENTTKTEALLAAVVESSEDAIISKTLEGHILSWNRAAERLFGYTAEEAIGQHITLLIPKDRHGEEHNIIERLKRGERIEHYETVRVSKHGRLIDISLAISPLRDRSGKIFGASKVARDISEQKRVQEALREADRRKDEFLATLAHELRNPLAPIRNAIHILESPKAKEEMKEEARNLMKRQVYQMTRLIDDLMDVSRVSQGKIELQKKQVTLNDIIQAAIETAKPLITEKGHVVTIDQLQEPIWLNVDIVRLSQVFANLLNNAAKYTNKGGHITVTLRKEGAEAVAVITDNGIGIPSAMLHSIFELFIQVDNSLERTQGGLGIGLTLVKELIELHEGNVKAYSEGEGKGSEFTVRLPIATEKAEEAEHLPSVEGMYSYRVLVVDDNPESAKTLGWTLELLGHEVTLAHDMETAMKAAYAFKPQVILLDIGLPGMNGYEVCSCMRKDPCTKDAFIIAQTGWGQEEHRRRSQDAGFDYHLIKPIDMDMLKDLLSRLHIKESERKLAAQNRI